MPLPCIEAPPFLKDSSFQTATETRKSAGELSTEIRQRNEGLIAAVLRHILQDKSQRGDHRQKISRDAGITFFRIVAGEQAYAHADGNQAENPVTQRVSQRCGNAKNHQAFKFVDCVGSAVTVKNPERN